MDSYTAPLPQESNRLTGGEFKKRTSRRTNARLCEGLGKNGKRFRVGDLDSAWPLFISLRRAVAVLPGKAPGQPRDPAVAGANRPIHGGPPEGVRNPPAVG